MATRGLWWSAALAVGSLLVACAAAPSREPATIVIGPSPASPAVPTAAPSATAVEAAASASPAEDERVAEVAASEVDRRIAGAVKRIGPDDVEVSRETIEDVLEHTAALTRAVRIRPVQENGAFVGLRLQAVRSDSWLGVLGLADGDLLRTINGYSLASPEQALEAYSRIRKASRITVGLRRGDKDRVIRIRVR